MAEDYSDEELERDLEFMRNLLADPARFKAWANDVLDRARRRSR